MATSVPVVIDIEMDKGLDNQKNYQTIVWEEAQAVCKVHLDPEQPRTIYQFDTCESLLQSLSQKKTQYSEKMLPEFLTRIEPTLFHLRSFTAVIALSVQGSVLRTAMIWGVVNLLIENTVKSVETLSKIVEMLDEMAHELWLFQEYEWLFQEHAGLEDILLNVFVDVIRFWTHTIKFLSRHPVVNFVAGPWNDVKKEFNETSTRIQKQIRQLKEKAQAISYRPKHRTQAELIQELESRFSQKFVIFGEEETAKLPCTNITSPRNPHFFGRKEILGHALDHRPERAVFRSWALWGMGGIGKSQTALEYVHQRISDGVQAVFWVSGETALDMNKSFTQIALALGLKGAAEGNDDRNQYLVTKWLQNTDTDWLLVFDNIEDPHLLRGCWPSAPHGSILVTSRNNVVSFDHAAGGVPLPTFDAHEGSAFLMNLLARKNYSEEEIASAETLSSTLGGLPLALNLMGTQIHTRGKPIKQFLTQYQTNAKRLHDRPREGIQNIYYQHSLRTVWQTSFDPLEADSVVIQGVLTFIRPDDVPEELFVPQEDQALGEEEQGQAYFQDSLRYLMESGAWSEFLELANLACKDKETLQWAHLCNSAGLVECERGNAKAAFVYMNTSRRIREKLLPSDHEELANIYNNYANVIMTESQDEASLAMAESLYLKALEIDKSKPEEESALILHIRWLNLATVWMFQKRYKEAVEAVETGRHYAIKNFGPACHFDGEEVCPIYPKTYLFTNIRDSMLQTNVSYSADYVYGDIEYFQGNWDNAKKRFARALVLFEEENELHPSTCAAMWKLASIAMRQGDLEQSINLFRKVRLLFELNEKAKGDKGETARCLRRLTEALEIHGDVEEAAELNEKAEAMRERIQGSRFKDLPDSEYSYDLLVFFGYA
ncbi:uncharacterized protein LY89DRAFT_790467 [Mollisia scopiformis]|uniref:Uncharacterized protein n=1 Tax=Mollisia scopiformis TaxID=149040 RepID=A0A132B2R2_MOLSC|nr:uncharacterized protein LY89DRAFT_790467 [Mollisia scopiformis]KUJ06621.1 hypothetical protein LY89DRAFT_790467 [Mollisia scopiformis]